MTTPAAVAAAATRVLWEQRELLGGRGCYRQRDATAACSAKCWIGSRLLCQPIVASSGPNLTRTTWVVEMCRPGYRACAADSHDHKQDPDLMFCFSELELEARFDSRRNDYERKRHRRTLRSAASQRSCCKSRLRVPRQESRKSGIWMDVPWPVDRGERGQAGSCFCCEAPAHPQVPVPVPGAGEDQKPPTAPTAPGMHR